MNYIFKVAPLIFFAASLCGCETVASVAQSVADKARGENKSPEPTKSPAASSSDASTSAAPEKKQSPNPIPTTAKTGNSIIDKCYENFVVDGSYLQGYRFRTNSTLSGVSRAEVFSKVVAATAEEGWIITSSDAATGTLSANHTRGAGRDAKTQVMSMSVIPVGKDVKVSATLNTPPSLFGSGRNEESLKKSVCEGIQKLAN